MISRLPRTRSRGAIAIQFALLAFAFFAIAAVLIDMRLASNTQQQMQIAADGAALESLARRDELGPTGQRQAARDRVAIAFDDDLTPSNGDGLNMGMGPAIDLVDGIGDANASARIVISAARVYDPALQLNTANKRWGDIVAGSFDASDPDHLEYPDYTRTDFTPAAPADTEAEAVLVRLRRTGNTGGLDAQPGVSSSAPPIPLLFGMGSLVRREPGDAYNPRKDGLTVRAASIAAARRALEISGPGPAYGYTALQRFVLVSTGDAGGARFPPPGQQFPPPGHEPGPTVGKGHLFPPPGQTFPKKVKNDEGGWADIWGLLSVGEDAVVYVDKDGFLHADKNDLRKDKDKGRGKDKDKDEDADKKDPIVGYAARVVGTGDGVVTQVGQIPDAIDAPEPHVGDTYVPIIRSMGDYFRVIGFGRIRVDIVDDKPRRLRITKLPAQVAGDGVSAVVPYSLEALAVIPGLRAAHADFPDAMTAPVLVR